MAQGRAGIAGKKPQRRVGGPALGLSRTFCRQPTSERYSAGSGEVSWSAVTAWSTRFRVAVEHSGCFEVAEVYSVERDRAEVLEWRERASAPCRRLVSICDLVAVSGRGRPAGSHQAVTGPSRPLDAAAVGPPTTLATLLTGYHSGNLVRLARVGPLGQQYSQHCGWRWATHLRP